MSNKLETLRAEIAALVSSYAKEQYKVKAFVREILNNLIFSH